MGVSTGTDEGPPERGGNHRETGADKGWDGNQDDYQQKGRVLSRLDLCISQLAAAIRVDKRAFVKLQTDVQQEANARLIKSGTPHPSLCQLEKLTPQ
jgi:hypothetical protein